MAHRQSIGSVTSSSMAGRGARSEADDLADPKQDHEGEAMSIAEAVAEATTYLEAHPDEARYRDAPAVARLVDGLRVEVTGTGGESTITDMPRGIGGPASAPPPGWLFRAAVASWVASPVPIRAPR